MTERRPKASEVESKASGQVASAPGRLRPDIREVARLAGVSIATVSRAFNKPDSLRPETKARVLRAANQINYIPDSAARALVSSRTRRIGAVIPTINDSIFAQFVEALQQRLAEAGYALLLGVSDFNSTAEARELRGLIEGGVDAVLLCGAARDESVYELLTSRGVPYLNYNILRPGAAHPSIGCDYRKSAFKAANYLLELGHRNIALVDHILERNDAAKERMAGGTEALRSHGLHVAREQTYQSEYSIENGRRALTYLLSHNPDLSAILFGNDVLAVGALLEAQRLGIDVPGDLSLIGFDDLELAAQISPGLTTIRVPTDEMGHRAAENLLLRLGNKEAPHTLEIETELVLRATTAPAGSPPIADPEQ